MEYTGMEKDPEETSNIIPKPEWNDRVLDAAHELLCQKLKLKSKGAIQHGHT